MLNLFNSLTTWQKVFKFSENVGNILRFCYTKPQIGVLDSWGLAKYQAKITLKQWQFFQIFFHKEVYFICMPFPKKKSYSPGEGLKWQEIYDRFQFCQKIRENLDISWGYDWFVTKFCCHADFKFWNIDQNLHKCTKWSKNFAKIKNYEFFFFIWDQPQGSSPIYFEMVSM